jgi:hypothetical protein
MLLVWGEAQKSFFEKHEVVAQVVEHLPRKLEAISSSLSTTKKRLGWARLSWGT